MNAYAEPNREVLACLRECGECAIMCARCAHHCLHLGGHHAGAEHQGIMRDCEEICALAASFMARGSAHAGHICRECAEICTRCAEDCERMAQGDAMMIQCAKVCRSCAEACEKMAAAGV
jgi:hypothetical protein